MQTSSIDRITRAVLIRFSAPLTVLLVVLAAFGFYFGSRIQLKLSLTDLLPEKYPAVVKFNELTEIVGGVGFFTVLLHAEDGKSHLDAAPKVIAALTKSPLVRSGGYAREERFFVDRMLYYFELNKLKELESNLDDQIKRSKRRAFDIGLWDETEKKSEETPVFDDQLKKMAQRSEQTSEYLTSADGKDLLMMIKPSFDSMELGKTEELVNFTSETLRQTLPPGVGFAFGERYYNKLVDTQTIQSDIYVLGSASILFIALCLLVYLRSIRGLLIVFIPVFMGLGITVGTTYLLIGHINIVTGFLMGIVSGLGVDYGIHLLLRLRMELKEPSGSDPDPIWRTLHSSGHAVFTGALAAAFAFYLLCFSDFRAFSEFGFVCGTGIAAVFLALILSFSTLARLLREKPRAATASKKSSKLVFPVLPIPKGLWIGCGISLLLMTATVWTGFEYDFDKLMQHSQELEAVNHRIDDIYGRSSVPAAVWTASKETGLKLEKTVKERYMPALISEVISGASIVPDHQIEKQEVLERIGAKLKPLKDRWIRDTLGVSAESVRTWTTAQPFVFAQIPEHIQDALRGTRADGYLIYLYPAIKLSNAVGVHRFADMMRSLDREFPDTLSGSDSVIFADILHLIKHDGSRILAVIFLAVGFFIWLNTRKLGDALLSYVPLLLSLPLGMGLMALFGIKFNIFNISIIPSFVALGIDVPIHLVHRSREIGSAYRAVRDLAASVNLALLTAGIGFGALIFARTGVLKSLGWIALLGTAAIWWIGMFLLPAYLEWVERRRAAGSPPAKHSAAAC